MRIVSKWVVIFMLCIGGNMSAQDKHTGHIDSKSTAQTSVKVDFIEINKVQVPFIFEKSKNLPVGSVQLVFVGGSADTNIAGLAKVSAKILNEGTRELGNVAFANRLESKAIRLYANAGLQTLGFDMSYLKEFEDESFSLLAMLLKDPNLTQQSLDKIKTLTLSQIARNESDFDDVAEENLNKILFKNTPLAIPLLGEKASIESITLKDAEAFLAKNLVLHRLIIIAGGDIQEEKLRANLINTLQSLPLDYNLRLQKR